MSIIFSNSSHKSAYCGSACEPYLACLSIQFYLLLNLLLLSHHHQLHILLFLPLRLKKQESNDYRHDRVDNWPKFLFHSLERLKQKEPEYRWPLIELYLHSSLN